MKKGYATGNSEWYLKAFSSFEKDLNGLAVEPIHKKRKLALNNFKESGFPTQKNEEWKYTDVGPISETDFEPLTAFDASKYDVNSIKNFLFKDLDDHRLVFVNGHFADNLSTRETLSDKVQVSTIADAIKSNDIDVLTYLGQYARAEDDPFTALNTAFILNGTFIKVASGVIIDKPIHILFLSAAADQPVLHQPRNLIIVGEHSQISVIESYAPIDSQKYFTNVVTEIILKEQAVLEHFKIQTESQDAFHIGTIQVHQARSSNYKSHVYSFGGRVARNNINTTLDGEGIENTLNGLYIGNQNQVIDNHTTINHARPNCNSIELYKGILDDNARGVFNGKIFVRQDAQKTNAIQANNCILLSDNAAIDTKPQLEIFADDVRCTHGATVGQLDEDAFFYMRARGIEKTTARNLLIHAFAADVFDRIEVDPIREKILDIFIEKLHTIKPE
jgi:Fe-S cluster assembly protein SufD